MGKKHDSPQEELMAMLAERSMGAPFVFFPDEYRKGNATREGADLAWASNQCVVLFYCRETKKRDKGSDGNRVFHDCVVNCLKQARGWLAAWRKHGERLTGRNSYQHFDIPHNAYKHVVVISVVDCERPLAMSHRDFEERNGVTLCASLPMSMIKELVSTGASALDLLHIVSRLRAFDRALSESEACDLVRAYNRLCWEASGAVKVWPDQLDARFYELASHIKGRRVRQQVPPKPGLPILIDYASWIATSEIFNDMPLVDYLRILSRLQEGIDGWPMPTVAVSVNNGEYKEVSDLGFAFGVLNLNHYDMQLVIASPNTLELDGEAVAGILSMNANKGRRGAADCIPAFIYDPHHGFSSLLLNPRIFPSHTEVYLDTLMLNTASGARVPHFN